MARPRYAEPAERLIANSIVSTDSAHAGSYCWVWIGKVTWSNGSNGRIRSPYPAMTMRRDGKVVNVRAHRQSFEVFKHVKLLPDEVIMHLCNNTLCINPAHLERGSQSENVRQCIEDGRHKSPFRDPDMETAL